MRVLRCAGVCLISSAMLNSMAQAPSSELCSDFKKLINGQAYIRYFKVGLPGNIFIVDGKPLNGWVYYEGAIQKDTFWIRNCTNSIAAAAIIMPGWLVGMSRNERWSYSDQMVAISPRGSKVESALDKRTDQVFGMVRQALGLGAATMPGSFHFFEGNRFAAKTADGNILKGHFNVSPEGYPLRCEYGGPDWAGMSAVVTYDYDDSERTNCLPSRYSVKTYSLSRKVDEAEYQIVECILGDSVLPEDGFTLESLTNMGGINLTMKNVVGITVHRDGAMFQMGTNGELKRLGQGNVSQADRFQNRRLLILCGICVTMLPISWFIARAMRSANNNRVQS